jgi:spermidine synthase
MLFWVCQILVFLTGFTGLVYQVTWQKYLANFLGSHASATTIILGVFFLFLTLGYLTLGRNANRLLKNQFLFYGIIEGVIGLYCLLSPVYFDWLTGVFGFHVTSETSRLFIDSIFAALFIGFPTYLMGATIPVLTEALSASLEVSHKTHSLIYGINTAGAFFGTLICGFVLIEKLGLPATLIVTSFLNIFVGLAAYTISKNTKFNFSVKTFVKEAKPDTSKMIYLISFVSGFYFFSFENIFIRLAGLSLGSSTYTYTIIVSAFILAIALGSLLVNQYVKKVEITHLEKTFTAMFVAFYLIYLFIPYMPAAFVRIRWLFQNTPMNHGWYWAAVLGGFLVLLVLPVGIMGAALPMLFGYIRSSKEHLNSSVGRLYAVNSLGCAAGSFVGGYLLYSVLSIHEIYKLNLLLIAFCGVLLFRKKKTHFAAGALALLILLPKWRESAFVPGLYLNPQPPAAASAIEALESLRRRGSAEIIFTEHDANTSVHVLSHPNGELGLFVNGKPDALTKTDHLVRKLTPLIPMSIAPSLKKVFIIGLGAGLSAGVASGFPENESVKVAEISKGVIDAVKIFDEHNQLSKRAGKVKIVQGDAYKVLKADNEVYDVILCEPSNVWVSGVEKLYTYEFLKQAADKLNPDGIYSQWFSLKGIDDETFRSVLFTFNSVFPWTTVWHLGGSTISILGSKKEPVANIQLMKRRFMENSWAYLGFGFRSPFSILGLQALPPIGAYALVKDFKRLHTLANPTLGFAAARGYFTLTNANVDSLLTAIMTRPFPDNFKSRKYLYESISNELDENFYDDGIGYLKYAVNDFTFLRNRLEISKALRFPQLKSNSNLGTQLYLLGKNTKAEIVDVMQNYSRLTQMFMFPQIQKIVSLVPKKCRTDDCYRTKYQLLVMNDLKDLDGLTEENKEKFEEQFESSLR